MCFRLQHGLIAKLGEQQERRTEVSFTQPESLGLSLATKGKGVVVIDVGTGGKFSMEES